MRKISLTAAVLAALCAAPTAQAWVVIEIDKSMQRMTVSVDGVQRHSWPVSTGRAGYSTPEGSYTPFRLEERPSPKTPIEPREHGPARRKAS